MLAKSGLRIQTYTVVHAISRTHEGTSGGEFPSLAFCVRWNRCPQAVSASSIGTSLCALPRKVDDETNDREPPPPSSGRVSQIVSFRNPPSLYTQTYWSSKTSNLSASP